MSDVNNQQQPGLSSGIKTVLILLGIFLSIVIFLIWSGIIRGGTDLVTKASIETEKTSEQTDEQTDSKPEDPLAQPRNAVIAIVDAPKCESAETDARALSEFVTVAEQEGGLSDNDQQLIVDTLNKVDETCPKDFTLDISNQISGAGVPLALAEISQSTDWVTKVRPAPSGAQELTDFSTDNRNIHCTMEDTRVACSIYAYSFPSVPDTCETYTQTYSVGDATDADALCAWRVQSDTVKNEDGKYANSNFACEVRDGGSTVECWSQLSGRGFELNRENGRTF